jgi:hypothetical protein
LEPSRIVSKTRALDGTLLETKQLFFSRPQFVQVARADSVTLTVGSLSFPIDRVLRTDLRLILDQVFASDPRQASEVEPADTSGVPNKNGPDQG